MGEPGERFSLTPGKLALPLAIACGVAGLDQWSKLAVVRTFGLFEGKEILPGAFNLVHVRNTGVAFSLFSGMDPRWSVPVLVLATALAAAAVVGYLGFLPRGGAAPPALGLILGGAAGNLADRARLGYVVDFLDLYWRRFHWPAFNVADIAITVGVVVLALDLLRESGRRGANPPPA